ncbi:MAG TPA: DUF6519 domain-containing protein, partial [Pyrinomonadaceae bacterium]|nr:DUF6519 domain-containing protein [Pyrinomonadaceae bacterium]
MKGDFSSQREERRHNFTGVLHQQGRVLLDSDWNAQTVIVNDWQDTAGRDIIGSGVAAIPSENPNGFKITKAHHDAGKDVVLTVTPGRLWADGLLAQLYGDPNPDVPSNPPQSAPDPEPAADVTRTATYLQTSAPTINAGDRDAVILELWREEISGFQMPAMLVEAALGGPDTTERVHTATAFRLMRLSAGEDCETIAGKLKDDWSKKGKLIVSLTKSTPGTGDCPTIASGGYTGFEHNLYRIEIADLDDMTVPLFKWSQYGGGLVGRGIFNANDITINANTQAIINSGLKNYYLELLVYDDKRGRWRVTYGADATLNGSVLSLTTVLFGNASGKPNANDTVFFRLWNGTAKIQDFVAQATLLPNDVGINLKFDAPAADNYKPGDYWTFDVRVPVGDNTNPDPLVNNEPPKGIHYHRVP